MTYEQAEIYRNENEMTVTSHEPIETFPYKVKYVLIAPNDITQEQRIDLLIQSLGNDGNHSALFKNGWINRNVDVYVYGQTDKIYHEYLLYNYLSDIGQ